LETKNIVTKKTWLAFIIEIQIAYWFIKEYGPKENDPSLNSIEEKNKGTRK